MAYTACLYDKSFKSYKRVDNLIWDPSEIRLRSVW